MMKPLSQMVRTAWQGAIEVLTYVPLLMLLPVLLGSHNPGVYGWLLALVACYPLGRIGEMWLTERARLWRAGLSIVLVAAWSWVLPFATWHTLALFLIGFWAARRGAMMGRVSWAAMFPAVHLWIGLLAYFFTSFIYPRVEQLEASSGILWGLGAVMIALTVIYSNRRQLKAASLPGKQEEGTVNREMGARNAMLLVGLLVVVAAAGSYRMLHDLIGGWLLALRERIENWFATDAVEEPIVQQPDMDMGVPPGLGEEPGEPSWIMRFLEQAAYYVMIALLVVGAVLLVYALIKLGIKAWRIVKAWLASRGVNWEQAETAGYVDEKESLLNLDRVRKNSAKRWREMWNRPREPKWNQLTSNRDKVRYLYRHVIRELKREGYEPSASLSPSETLREAADWVERRGDRVRQIRRYDLQLLEQYHRARYSGHNIPDEDVQALKKQILP